MNPTLKELQGHSSPHVLFRAIGGSRAYGLQHSESDTDIRGIFVLPQRAYLALTKPPPQVSDERGDTVYFSLRRFLELASAANPNILELLYLPEDCVLYCSALMKELQEQRSLFITKRAYDSHIQYANAQIKKAKGRNRWINQPQPQTPPQRQDFCWFIARQTPTDRFPMRAQLPKAVPIDLDDCRCAAVDHVPGLYRLYRGADPSGKGIFRNDVLVCSSIPREQEESHCLGLFYVNEPGYQQAKKQHRNYWDWIKKRNPKRWQHQEQGQLDYDAKNMMHTFRLLFSGERILRCGQPLIRFTGEKLTFLREIRDGIHAYHELLEKAQTTMAELKDLADRANLPTEPDEAAIDQLLVHLTNQWERHHVRPDT